VVEEGEGAVVEVDTPLPPVHLAADLLQQKEILCSCHEPLEIIASEEEVQT
jgi:hypothetical protein